MTVPAGSSVTPTQGAAASCSRGILQEAWEIIRSPTTKNSQVALAIAVIVASSLVGIVGAMAYGFAARGSGFWNSISGAFAALLGCVGAFSAGGMLGLLFGSPTWGSTPAAAGKGGGDAQGGIRPNTSLERIAEWLTTMIVGLSLVHLPGIRDEATNMAVWMTQAITSTNTKNGTPGIAIAVSFSFAGFLLVYLWSMRFLPNELRESYDHLKERAEQAESALAAFKKTAVFEVPESKLDAYRVLFQQNAIDVQLTEEVLARYRTATKVDAEPMKNFGPSQDPSGYGLSAAFKDIGSGMYEVVIQLAVPANNAATKVFWLLHNTYAPDVVSECPINGARGTSYTSNINEPFWVGALVPLPGGKALKLALNLYEVPGAPKAP